MPGLGAFFSLVNGVCVYVYVCMCMCLPVVLQLGAETWSNKHVYLFTLTVFVCRSRLVRSGQSCQLCSSLR